eukprot:Rmarinus@m.29893
MSRSSLVYLLLLGAVGVCFGIECYVGKGIQDSDGDWVEESEWVFVQAECPDSISQCIKITVDGEDFDTLDDDWEYFTMDCGSDDLCELDSYTMIIADEEYEADVDCCDDDLCNDASGFSVSLVTTLAAAALAMSVNVLYQ